VRKKPHPKPAMSPQGIKYRLHGIPIDTQPCHKTGRNDLYQGGIHVLDRSCNRYRDRVANNTAHHCGGCAAFRKKPMAAIKVQGVAR